MNLSRYFKIGIFFISIGIAGTGYVIMSTDGFNGFNTRQYEVVLDDASGLTNNSKVYLAGVPVGKIHQIELSGGQAIVTISFLHNVEIRSDARISRKSSSLLGTSILNLDSGSPTAAILRPGSRIEPVKETADMNSVIASAGDLSAQVSDLIGEFQGRQMELLAVSLETFNSLAKKMDERSDAEMDRVSRILEATARLTERMDRILAEKESDLGSSATEMRLALENLRAITGEIRQGSGNLGQAVYDDQLYANLVTTSAEAAKAAEKLQTTLDSITRAADGAGDIVRKVNSLGVQVDSDVTYGVGTGDFRAGASLRLEPESRDRWYRIGVTGTGDGVSERTVTRTDWGGTVSTTDTTETTYGVAVNAELARRVGAFTLRGGLLESTAGFGVEFAPFRWITLSGELFDFKKTESPNLRGTVTVYPYFDPNSAKPWNWVYLRGGVSSALDERRDWFIGAGFRFADEEIRGLVGLVPYSK